MKEEGKKGFCLVLNLYFTLFFNSYSSDNYSSNCINALAIIFTKLLQIFVANSFCICAMYIYFSSVWTVQNPIMFTYHRMFTCPRCKSCTFVTHDSKPRRIRRHLNDEVGIKCVGEIGWNAEEWMFRTR